MNTKQVLNPYVPYILMELSKSVGLSYSQIKNIIKISDVTLSKYLKTLRKLDWIECYAQTFTHSKTSVKYRLSKKGEIAFVDSGIKSFILKLERMSLR